MPSSRDTGRQRRANENRAAREALNARRDAASRKSEPDDQAPAAPRRSRRTRGQAAPVTPPRGARTRSAAASPNPTIPPADAEPVPGFKGWLLSTRAVPGGPQMFGAFMLSVVGAVLLLFLSRVGDKKQERLPSLYAEFGLRAVLLVLIPVVIAAVPLALVRNPRRRLAWNVAALLYGAWVLIAGGGSPLFLVAVMAMVWGLMKLSKAEGPRSSWFGGRRRREPAADDAVAKTEPPAP